eukprot:m.1324728 g.1324728  ORF g.1324728 m.1324728 type:complete len:134 (-) comp24852_c2_seq22:3720-4121(-)
MYHCEVFYLSSIHGSLEGIATAVEWWLVKNKSGLRGYVPRDYLDPTDDVTLKQEVRRLRQDKMSHKGCPTAVRNTSGTTLIARFDYITSKPKELGFVRCRLRHCLLVSLWVPQDVHTLATPPWLYCIVVLCRP